MAQETFHNTYIAATREDNLSSTTAATFTFVGGTSTIAFQVEAKAGNVYWETDGTVASTVAAVLSPYIAPGNVTDWMPCNDDDGHIASMSMIGSITSTAYQVLELVAINR